MSGAAVWSRRRAIVLLVRALALVPGLGPALRPQLAFGLPAVSPPLGTHTIVALHLEHLKRCGAACAARAARIGPALLAAARRCEEAAGPAAARAAFALVEHFGELPPVHGPFGGSQ
ncbi:MAG: hypothetical protein ACREOC_07900 [Gemmatimonadales bacterium]